MTDKTEPQVSRAQWEWEIPPNAANAWQPKEFRDLSPGGVGILDFDIGWNFRTSQQEAKLELVKERF